MVAVNNNYIIDSDPQDHVLMNCGMKIIRKKYSKCDCMGGRLCGSGGRVACVIISGG